MKNIVKWVKLCAWFSICELVFSRFARANIGSLFLSIRSTHLCHFIRASVSAPLSRPPLVTHTRFPHIRWPLCPSVQRRWHQWPMSRWSALASVQRRRGSCRPANHTQTHGIVWHTFISKKKTRSDLPPSADHPQ